MVDKFLIKLTQLKKTGLIGKVSDLLNNSPPPFTKGGLLSRFSLQITSKLLSANQNAANSETEKVLIGNSCYT